MGVFTNVDSDVGVERLQLFGKELIGQRVEAVRAPVESGPFQKVKSRKTNIISHVCVLACVCVSWSNFKEKVLHYGKCANFLSC